MYRMHCAEIWGGTRATNEDLSTRVLTASLYSNASEGCKGGDIYYFSVCEADMLTRIAIADVAGHGPDVNRISRWLYDSLAAQVNSHEVGGLLARLNQQVVTECGLKAMTTAAVAGFCFAETQLYISYAGHPPLLLWRQDEQYWRPIELKTRLEAANLPLGVMESIPYEQEQIRLVSGDRLFLYTDGLIEAPDAQGQLFGEERLRDILEQASNESVPRLKQAVLRAIHQHTGGTLTHDDITLITIEIN
ncbi:PP2C family protein-serine/threonine phosphatase [Nitrosococcus watsonii]|uniref:Protein serine/threonine phosphatase n=1 Tax=Nitrosococcus watsoni (strain C-113) TaxID=105559 RepID=D8K7M8_NITWC|nr:PP2C family protein-serine/threonine phosphatase [Nitrosococcus watsonii]ADJ28905.1 protein serine/threonine phosphatase [Nitrosococcus watsonii C-113]